MRLKAFAIFDSQALVYNTPFFFGQDGQALRAVSDLVNDPQSSVSKHPADYTLYRVGEFDDQKGLFESTEPVVLVQLAALVNREVNEDQLGLGFGNGEDRSLSDAQS